MFGFISIYKILFILVFYACFTDSETENVFKLFKDYVIKFNKTYHNDSHVFSERFPVFKVRC